VQQVQTRRELAAGLIISNLRITRLGTRLFASAALSAAAFDESHRDGVVAGDVASRRLMARIAAL